ncbi:hypothetical protein H5410_047996 [Solanum commersonii]|uniref:Putative plant transposon protein domain-containing protein n=1 Tax=Solanum commersonii TaxID=4109 RepID=A0A9J5XIP6_SOLCO|nr:hypothetical protein H5410_047996 [Solanum commersonii]
MAPKAKNIVEGAGFKRNKKGEDFGSSSNWEPFQKFSKKAMERYVREFYANWITEPRFNKSMPIWGNDVKFTAKVLNTFLGTLNCDAEDFNRLKKTPPLMRYTSYVRESFLKIMCSVFLLAKHLSDVTRDRVVLVHILMKGMPINVRAILRQYDKVQK